MSILVLGSRKASLPRKRGDIHNQEGRRGKWKEALRFSVTWLRQGDVLLASLVFASTTESITVGFGLLLTSPSSCARATPGNQVPGYTHHLPGRMSKTSVCEATELTSFSKSNCCFSPGYRKRFATKEPDLKTFPPSPPRLQLHHSRDAGPPVPGSGYALPEWAAAPPADAWWV